MGQNQSHHVVLNLADTDLNLQTGGRKFTADIKAAKTLADLKKAASQAFGNPPNNHEFVFYALDNTQITSDKEFHELYNEAVKAFEEDQARRNKSIAMANSQSQQQNNNNESATSSASSNSITPSSSSQQQQRPLSPDTSITICENPSDKNKQENIFHIEVTIEPISDKNEEEEAKSKKTTDDSAGENEEYRNYLSMELELPEHDVEVRSFTARPDDDAKLQQKQDPLRLDGLSTAADAPSSSAPKNCDVLFIGAGPIGLWTAVQLKIRAPHVKIIMVEKYAVFQRKHVVLLNARSLWFMPNDRRLKDFAKSLPHAVRTNDLEDRLSKLAVDLGIEIVIENCQDVAAAVERYQPVCVVGSDGSHSITRKSFMTHGHKHTAAEKHDKTSTNDKDFDFSLDTNELVDNTVTVKYEILQNAAALSTKELYSLQKMLPSEPFVESLGLFEHVSNRFKDHSNGNDGGQSTSNPKSPKLSTTAPAVLIINGVPKYIMDTIKDSTFRNPVRLDERDEATKAKWQRTHPHLRATIAGFFKAKDVIKSELRDVSSVCIAPVPLRLYRAKWFSEVVDMGKKSNSNNSKNNSSSPSRKIPTFLVGDSATGVPYFRAINNGFYAGSRLASLLASAMPKAEIENVNLDTRKKLAGWLSSAVDQYHMYMVLLSSKEMLRARAKAVALQVARNAISMQSHSPIQVFKLSDNEHKVKAVKSAIDEQLIIAAAVKGLNENKDGGDNNKEKHEPPKSVLSSDSLASPQGGSDMLSDTKQVQAAMASLASS